LEVIYQKLSEFRSFKNSLDSKFIYITDISIFYITNQIISLRFIKIKNQPTILMELLTHSKTLKSDNYD